MGKLAETVIAVHNFLKQKANGKKIVVALTGDYGTGKTTVGNLLEKFFDDVVFVNGDFFKKKIISKRKKDNYREFISSYNIPLIKKVVGSFLEDKNCFIYCTVNGKTHKKIFNCRRKKVLLLESVFIFDGHFSDLPIDYIIELKSPSKKIEKRRNARSNNKLDRDKFNDILYTYKVIRVASKRKPDIVLDN